MLFHCNFILTNVLDKQVCAARTEDNESPVHSESWRHRHGLFTKYLLPSGGPGARETRPKALIDYQFRLRRETAVYSCLQPLASTHPPSTEAEQRWSAGPHVPRGHGTSAPQGRALDTGPSGVRPHRWAPFSPLQHRHPAAGHTHGLHSRLPACRTPLAPVPVTCSAGGRVSSASWNGHVYFPFILESPPGQSTGHRGPHAPAALSVSVPGGGAPPAASAVLVSPVLLGLQPQFHPYKRALCPVRDPLGFPSQCAKEGPHTEKVSCVMASKATSDALCPLGAPAACLQDGAHVLSCFFISAFPLAHLHLLIVSTAPQLPAT